MADEGSGQGDTGKLAAEYAMAFDLLSKIAHSETEDQAVQGILRTFEMLFSAGSVQYVTLENGQPRQVHASQGAEDAAVVKHRLASLEKAYALTESGAGFLVKIRYAGTDLGILEVDAIGFPENTKRYLNLTLSMADVCGLAVENARRHQKIVEGERRLRREKEKLQEALDQVKTLSGLLPICGHCKKVRDDEGYWNQIDSYIQAHSEVVFSHGICQECAKKYYADYNLYDDE